MKIKLKEVLQSPTLTRRLGDFICNFVAVVLGIVITFVGSDMIASHNKSKEMKQALQLIKSELLLNQEVIKEMMDIELFNKNGAIFMLQYKDNIDKAPLDSVNLYGYFPYRSRDFLPTTDALEMFRGSSLMQSMKNKELVVQIIQAYAIIKNSHLFYEGYSETKNNNMDKLTSLKEFRDFSNQNKTLIENWKFIFSLPEGLGAIRQVSYIHDDPNITYGNYLEIIDKTIADIDKECN